MASPYTKDLVLEVAYKLSSTYVFSISILSNEWVRLITPEFWLTKFIRNFGSSLPIGADYKLEYLVIEKLGLYNIYSYVVIKGYIKFLAYLLNKWDTPKHILITYAAIYGNLEIVKFLLANGAEACDKDMGLLYASEYGHLDIVEFLLANGANIHVFNDKALQAASKAGHIEVVKFLLANGALIHAYGDEALILAAANLHLDVVEFLLANGANIDILNVRSLKNKDLISLINKFHRLR